MTVAASTTMRMHTNSKGQHYPQWFNEAGEMVGCGCDEARAVTIEKYNMKPCHHRVEHNGMLHSITGVDLVAHITDEYEGCDYCGLNHKSWNCPF